MHCVKQYWDSVLTTLLLECISNDENDRFLGMEGLKKMLFIVLRCEYIELESMV